MIFTRKCVARAVTTHCRCRKLSSKVHPTNKVAVADEHNPSLIRNIGILAHIDAGKTTTTERMLFFSGTISSMGEVHHGNTVTDFMDQERERGITITSACVTFKWDKHKINLLDTPGHIDFTMEVEQTLSVMDGAIIILDGSAGVEAQTVTVWKQADRFQIPRLVYVNKMDKPKAEFTRCTESIQKAFNVSPLVLQIPVFNSENAFHGVVDLLNLQKYEWKSSSCNFTRTDVDSKDGHVWENTMLARMNLTETLADLDDKVADIVLSDESHLETIPASTLQESIRRVTLAQKGVPVLCGSSYKNMGVRLLMTAVNNYLPSPFCSQSSRIRDFFGDKLCAKAFKVRHDNFRGAVTFFRIYSGQMSKGQKIYNAKKDTSEVCDRLYLPYADDYEEVTEVGAGNVAAVMGLKCTTTGDLVTHSSSSFASAQKALEKRGGDRDGAVLSTGPIIPDPVFFCSIEAASQRFQPALDAALKALEREDPSLRVTMNEETGQTVLGGMGELHLDVIRTRIRTEYKVDVDTGPLMIAYREALVESVRDSLEVKHQLGSGTHLVNITASVLKVDDVPKDRLLLDRRPDNDDNVTLLHPRHLAAVKAGVESALESGPKLYCPVTNAVVMLHSLSTGRGTSDTMVTSATVQLVKKLLQMGGTRLLEPIMAVEVVCTDREMTDVMMDLGRRRAKMSGTDARGSDLVIRALVPLSELLGYSTDLRVLTSGRAAFTMELDSYHDMAEDEERKAIKSVTGF